MLPAGSEQALRHQDGINIPHHLPNITKRQQPVNAFNSLPAQQLAHIVMRRLVGPRAFGSQGNKAWDMLLFMLCGELAWQGRKAFYIFALVSIKLKK